MDQDVHFTDEELKIGSRIFTVAGLLSSVLLVLLTVALVFAGVRAVEWWVAILIGSAAWIGLKILKRYCSNIVRDNNDELAQRAPAEDSEESEEATERTSRSTRPAVLLLAIGGILPASLWYGFGRLMRLAMGGGAA